MQQIVTAKDVAQYLKLSESTIYKLATSGEIPGFKIGDSWRFDMEEILSLINKSKRETRPGSNGSQIGSELKKVTLSDSL